MMRPVFPGVRPPSIDFQAVRDQRRSRPLYFVVALDSARSIANGITEDVNDVSGKALQINSAGNAWWSDPIYDSVGNYIAGVAVAHFEDSALGLGVSTPITILPNSAQRIPFTRVIIENFAQAGKKLRVVFGVDIDFVPGFNAQATIGGLVTVLEQGYTYGAVFQSTAVLAALTSEQAVAPGTNVNGLRLWKAESNDSNGGPGVINVRFAAHTAAPNSLSVGDQLAQSRNDTTVTLLSSWTKCERQFIASGKGLFTTAGALQGSGARIFHYTAL